MTGDYAGDDNPRFIKREEVLVTYPDCGHRSGFDLCDNCRMCKRPREVEAERVGVSLPESMRGPLASDVRRKSE
jgi:methionyl-tRNA synthetase